MAQLVYEGIWREFRNMHHGRTQPNGHMTGQAEVALCLLSGGHSQVSMWLTELSSGGCQLLVPDLRCTKLALYRGSLGGSPVHVIQIGVGNISQ